MNGLIEFNRTNDIVSDLKYIIDTSQKSAYQAVNVALVYRNWLIGYRIAEEILNDNEWAEYGSEVIKKLSKELTKLYRNGLIELFYIVVIDLIISFLGLFPQCGNNLKMFFFGHTIVF